MSTHLEVLRYPGHISGPVHPGRGDDNINEAIKIRNLLLTTKILLDNNWNSFRVQQTFENKTPCCISEGGR